MTTCIFCKIAQHEIEHNTIWVDENFIAFLDKYPQQRGHILLIPKAHHEDIFDMPDELYGEFLKRAKMLGGILKRAIKTERVGLVVDGFGVAHVHIHLIPTNVPGSLDSANKIVFNEVEFPKIVKLLKAHF
ncbi:MAG: HIT family protein [Bacteroidota bacterium]